MDTCHWKIGPPKKWSGRTIFTGKNGPPGTNFSEKLVKILFRAWSFGPPKTSVLDNVVLIPAHYIGKYYYLESHAGSTLPYGVCFYCHSLGYRGALLVEPFLATCALDETASGGIVSVPG